MTHFNLEVIAKMERFYRANFINCLSGFKSPVLIGTVNSSGDTNLAIFNNIVHLGSDPALIGFINRPREAAPHTLSNIENTGIYTINHISSDLIHKAHQTSAKYPKDVSEFEKTGLTADYIGNCRAPFVAKSPVKYSLELKEIIPVQLNNTFFVIGAIMDVYMDDNILEEDGCLDLKRANIITSLGVNGYYSVNKLVKLPYAKP